MRMQFVFGNPSRKSISSKLRKSSSARREKPLRFKRNAGKASSLRSYVENLEKELEEKSVKRSKKVAKKKAKKKVHKKVAKKKVQ